jgi:hypothetical protein
MNPLDMHNLLISGLQNTEHILSPLNGDVFWCGMELREQKQTKSHMRTLRTCMSRAPVVMLSRNTPVQYRLLSIAANEGFSAHDSAAARVED